MDSEGAGWGHAKFELPLQLCRCCSLIEHCHAWAGGVSMDGRVGLKGTELADGLHSTSVSARLSNGLIAPSTPWSSSAFRHLVVFERRASRKVRDRKDHTNTTIECKGSAGATAMYGTPPDVGRVDAVVQPALLESFLKFLLTIQSTHDQRTKED